MSWTPENSAIRVTPDLERQIANAGPEEIKSLLHRAAIDQGLASPDPFSPDILIPTSLADNAPKRFASTLVVNGQKKVFEGESELEVQRQMNACLRETFEAAQQLNSPDRQDQQAEQRRDPDTGRFVAEPRDPAAAAELDLRFKRGEISAADYIEQSGALNEFLNKAGVPLEILQETVAEKRNAQTAQDWAEATEQFRARHPEWIGGQENVQIIGQILADNNLVDADDKLTAMEAAYNHARENSLLVANPELELVDKINNARSFEEIKQALHPETSGFFGR